MENVLPLEKGSNPIQAEQFMKIQSEKNALFVEKIYTGVLIFGLFLMPMTIAKAQARGVAVKVKSSNGQTTEVKLYDGSFALVIGESNYTNGWDNLAGVASDVIAVKQILEIGGFKVETAENLNSSDFDVRIKKFVDDYGFEPNNRILIYYAGHGHTLKSSGDGRELGYVVPVDAPDPSKDEKGFRRKAISMDTIQNYAKEIQAKHAMFIFDSCFSGKLVSRNAIVIPPIIEESVAYPVRQFITAGAANQPVPDESIFRRSFVRGLEGEADRNKDGYITGTELADFLKEKVTNYSNRSQTPQYGKINDVELDKGDFVFVAGNSSGAVISNPPVINNRPVINVEGEFWNAIKDSTDVEDFKLYEKTYPNGTYIALADLKIKRLSKLVPGTLISNRLGMKFAYIPPGSFQMGDSSFGPAQLAEGSSVPLHMVTLTRGFYMGITEVTQAQWLAVMGSNPSTVKNCETCPVEQVSWDEVQQFISKLNARGEGGYRLPTEAEWECAARAGMTVDIAENIISLAWYSDNSGFRPHEVATRQPNGWGLYDMHGNVHEWVQDWDGGFSREAVTDPIGVSSGSTRVLRGGSFGNAASNLRMAFRSREAESFRSFAVGFRVVRTK